MTVSVVAAAQDALLALLQASATDVVNDAVLGQPIDPPAEGVWVYEDVRAEHQWSQTGSTTFELDETFTLRIGVAVRVTGNWTAARDRAMVLAGEVEEIVFANPKLSGTIFECHIGPWALNRLMAGDSASIAVVDVSVECEAFVT